MFNRQTILKRRELAQEVADRLMAAEHAIDMAIARTAELTGFIPAARAEADLAKEQAYVSALEDQLDSAGLAIARKEATRGESP